MNALTRKVGPLPLWAWVGIAALGIAAGVYLRRRMANPSGSTIPADNAAASGAGSAGSPYPDFGGAVSGGGAGSGIAPAPSGIDPSQYVTDVLGAFQSGSQNALSVFGQGLQTGESFFGSPGGGFSTPMDPGPVAPAATPAAATTGKHSTAVSLRKAAPAFGGIASVRTKKGVKITTYRSGRVVEQRKGHKAYVAKKGR